MAKLGIGGDCSRVTEEDMQGGQWEPLPPGEYEVQISGTDYKSTKAGDGKVLHLDLIVMRGEYKGEKLRDWLVLEHPNETAVKIARAKLKSIALAIGHPTPDRIGDSRELERRSLLAQVKIEKSKDPKYGDGNKIVAYGSIEAADSNEARAADRTTAPYRDEPRPADDLPPF